MMLIKLYIIVSATLVGGTCLSTIMEIDQPNELAEIEDSTIRILTTCYGNKDKTIVLLGDFAGNFIEKLTSIQSFSLVTLDCTKKAEYCYADLFQCDRMNMYKVHLVVMTAAYYLQSAKYWITTYHPSAYVDAMASVVVLGWCPIMKYGPCKNTIQALEMLYNSYFNYMLNVNLICRHPTIGITLYTMNPFVNQAPAPWKLVRSLKTWTGYYIYFYARKYEEGERMCRNIDFDRTRNLGRSIIPTIAEYYMGFEVANGTRPAMNPIRRISHEEQKRHTFIDVFIAHVNATRKYIWRKKPVGEFNPWPVDVMSTTPSFVRTYAFVEGRTFTYPHGFDCVTFVTQFRGYKTQLQTILSVIDNNCWIGMYVACLITLIFFKFFLRQQLLVGVLNLCRLSCNVGLVTSSTLNASSQIYLGCLLFFVVTVQGIFQGNLASLLTHDFPDRQADSIQDLAELGYTIYLDKAHFIFFADPIFKGRLREVALGKNCIKDVWRDASNACVMWTARDIEFATQYKFHVSPNCIAYEYVSHMLPQNWFMEERLNSFLGMAIATRTMMPLSGKVDEERMIEEGSQEVILEPEVMTLDDLWFAFAILAIGLLWATVTFILELMIYRFQNRIGTTRVIVLN